MIRVADSRDVFDPGHEIAAQVVERPGSSRPGQLGDDVHLFATDGECQCHVPVIDRIQMKKANAIRGNVATHNGKGFANRFEVLVQRLHNDGHGHRESAAVTAFGNALQLRMADLPRREIDEFSWRLRRERGIRGTP